MSLRFACKDGRAQLVVGPDNNLVDLEKASNGRFTSEPIDAFRRWDEVREFAASCTDAGVPCSTDDLNAPSPWPSQVFGIGLNYRKHAEETGAKIPDTPLTFTKFPTSIGNPNADVRIDVDTADWEVELVVVISKGGRGISEADQMLTNVSQALAQCGSEQQVVQSQIDVLDQTKLRLKSTLSDIEDLDYTEAVARVNKEMVALQAAMASFGKIAGLSLFDHIR